MLACARLVLEFFLRAEGVWWLALEVVCKPALCSEVLRQSCSCWRCGEIDLDIAAAFPTGCSPLATREIVMHTCARPTPQTASIACTVRISTLVSFLRCPDPVLKSCVFNPDQIETPEVNQSAVGGSASPWHHRLFFFCSSREWVIQAFVFL